MSRPGEGGGRRRFVGEAGQAMGIGLVAVAIFAGGLAVLVHAARQALGREERVVPVAPVEYPTIGPAVPGDESQTACINRVIGTRLTWTAKGWRDPIGHAEPPLSGNAARDRGTVSAWTSGMQGYVDSIVEEWQPCLQRAPETPAAPTPVPTMDIVGTYDLVAEGESQSGGSTCSTASARDTMTVARSGNNVTFTIASVGMMCFEGFLGAGPEANTALRFDFTNITGTIDTEYYFRGDGTGSATVTPGSTGPFTYSTSGHFTVIDSKVELRDGVLTANGASIRYSARKR